MDKSFVCECGNDKFWFFWGFVRCTKCLNEYRETHLTDSTIRELWLRRFNIQKKQYNKNWERSKSTYK